MPSLRDSDMKLPMWSLVYLATISTSWPRSKGICTFTSAAPKASWDRDSGNRNLETRPYSSPPWFWLWLFLPPYLALPCPHCGYSCSHRSASLRVQVQPLSPHIPHTQLPCIGYPDAPEPRPSLSFPKGRNAVPVQLWFGVA